METTKQKTPFFSPQGDIALENERVLLRPLQADDWQPLVHFAIHEPEIWEHSLVSAAGAENLQAYLALAIKGREAGQEYPFIVWDKKLQRYAGSTRFYSIQAQHNTLQLGYTWFGRDFRGTGLNQNCKFLMLQLAFERWGFNRVEFMADQNNKRSIAAMQGIGCTIEGIMREHLVKPGGQIRSSVILSILRSEWQSGVKERLQARIGAFEQA